MGTVGLEPTSKLLGFTCTQNSTVELRSHKKISYSLNLTTIQEYTTFKIKCQENFYKNKISQFSLGDSNLNKL